MIFEICRNKIGLGLSAIYSIGWGCGLDGYWNRHTHGYAELRLSLKAKYPSGVGGEYVSIKRAFRIFHWNFESGSTMRVSGLNTL